MRACGDRVRIVVDADAIAGEVSQVATDAASDVEREPRPQPSEVPAIRKLDTEPALPRRLLKVRKPRRVALIPRHFQPGRSRRRRRAPTRSVMRESRKNLCHPTGPKERNFCKRRPQGRARPCSAPASATFRSAEKVAAAATCSLPP